MESAARSLAQHQVAVLLVGVRARGLRTDQHVADPDRARTFAVERALVVDAALGVLRDVLDVDALLDVLSRVREVQPEQLGVAALRDEVGRWVEGG